jgi:hypothetical protein
MYECWKPLPCFAGAELYAALRPGCTTTVREGDSPVGRDFPWSERHLRCVWFDPAYRPTFLTTHDGQRVTVENPGRWNLEAGPDFLDAALKLEPGGRQIRGDVELHIRPADWRHHGHANDPHYRRVIAHVTYFEGTLPTAELPAGAVQIALQNALKLTPSFSFDSLDVLAYPYARVETRPPCAAVLATWDPDDQGALLDAAGTERLRQKTEILARVIQEKGPEQALYEEILGALGYKHNRSVCRALAARIPMDQLLKEAANDPLTAYALLCGVAGLMPARSLPSWDQETRQFVRSLWDIWWKKQSEWETTALSRDLWVLHNLRPHNHPLRRLMAAAELFAGPSPLPQTLTTLAGDANTTTRTLLRLLEETGMCSHWAWHHALSSPRLAKPLALIGPGRAAALLNNAIAPWMAVRHPGSPATLDLLHHLPPEDDNRFIRHTAHSLFGHDHNPALYRTGLRQQGLLQLFHDFCLNSRECCGACTLPRALASQPQRQISLSGCMPHQKKYEAVAST